MFKKILLVILILGTVGLGVGLFISRKNINELKQQATEYEAAILELSETNSELSAKLNQEVETIPIYMTADENISSGTRLKIAMLKTVDVPKELAENKQFITEDDIQDFIGKEFKLNTDSGTILTKFMFREASQYNQSLYTYDIVPPFIPMDLKEGDFVSIRLRVPTTPGFTVLERKKVERIFEGVITIYVSEPELGLLTSMDDDCAQYGFVGVRWYLLKYTEDNEEQIPLYFVRGDHKTSVELNPNIEDKSRLINTRVRQYIDYVFNNLVKDAESKESNYKDMYNYGLADYNSVNTARDKMIKEEEKPTEVPETTAAKEDNSSGGLFSLD